MPPSLREWLPEDHLAWFVIDALEEIDLGAFYAAYRGDGWGRAAFDPKMMVALLLYAYAVGERSSRQIERRCREDIAFRVITANAVPDHATIARFRARHEQALAGTLAQLPALCARAGLVSVGVVALDGSLLAGTASPWATRSYSSICGEVERMLAEAAQADAAEDERLGAARGDELPSELADPHSRRERLRRCKEQLEQEQAAEEAAHHANLKWRAAWEAEHGRRLTGRKPTAPDPAALAARRVNTTDPDTRLMKRVGGKSVQGYDAQLVASSEQIILAAQVTQSHNDGDQLAPMVAQTAATLCQAGIAEPIGTVLADGGYWNASAIGEVREQGIGVLIPTEDRRRTKPRRLAAKQGFEAQRIEAVLSQPEGQALYRRHARFLLAALACERPSGQAAWACFAAPAPPAGCRASWSADNHSSFTGRLLPITVAFERKLAEVGVELINAAPAHPQTLGKLERFHRTLEEWLADEAPACDLGELQLLLDRFGSHYNGERPHQGIGNQTPAERYRPGPAPGALGALELAQQLKTPAYAPSSITRKVWRNGVLTNGGFGITVGSRFRGATVRIVEVGELVHVYLGEELIRVVALGRSRRYQKLGRCERRS